MADHSNVADARAGMTDKCDLDLHDSRTDSGFISSSNILVSEEIKDDQPFADSGVLDDHRSCQQSDPPASRKIMHLQDSGVDLGLSESLSSLSLKHPHLNDLSCPKIKEPLAPALPNWEHCYAQDEDGDTQLHIAIVQEFPELVKASIRAAPHPRLLDTPNDDAQSPLHLAVLTRQYEIVRWLIVAGARPCPRNLQGDSPLHLCARLGDMQCLKAIVDPVKQEEREKLHLCYPQQPYQPCDFDQWNYEGQTCVHVAAAYGHTDIIQRLIWCGANVNAREGTSGYTALHYALQRGDEEMAHFLLSQNVVNPTILTYGRKSVLQLGFHVPSKLVEELHSKGVESPYSSDEDYDDDDSEDEFPYDSASTNIYQSSMIQANA